jgi:membrane fusion protein, copper/silver efflux system
MSRLGKIGLAFIGGIVALAIGAGGGYWYAIRERQQAVAPAPEAPTQKPLFYRHPMNPEMTSPVPAKDEMGMDYVPIEEERGPPGTVKIDPVTIQTIGVRTAIAERRSLTRAVRAVGRVDYDEERLVQLHERVRVQPVAARSMTGSRSPRAPIEAGCITRRLP